MLFIAIILLIAGIALFPPFDIFALGGLAWPTSIALFVAGVVLGVKAKAWAKAKAAQEAARIHPDMKPGEVPLAEGWMVPKQYESTVRVDRLINSTTVSLIPAHARKATGWPVLVGFTMGGIGLFIGGIVSAVDHTPTYALAGLGIGVGLAFMSSHKLNHDPRGLLFAARIKATETYIDARNAEGKTYRYDVGKIDRIRKQSVYGGELGAHRPQQERFDWFAKHAFVIEITYEGRNIVLANGLDEPTAETAFRAISSQIGLS